MGIWWDGLNRKIKKIITVTQNLIHEAKYVQSNSKSYVLKFVSVGTMGPVKAGKFNMAEFESQYKLEKGALYRLNRDKTVSKQLDKISMSNGLAWSLDNTKFFYIDTLKSRVFSYDYNIDTGNIGKFQNSI